MALAQESVPLPSPEGPGPTGVPADTIEGLAGRERILGLIPFVTDLGIQVRWYHLVFTEDKLLVVHAFPKPSSGATRLFLPPPSHLAAPYPGVEADLGLVAIPQPLVPPHVAAVIPYASIRSVRLSGGRGPLGMPELRITRDGGREWWFFRQDEQRGDVAKGRYAKDLLLELERWLPFPVQLTDFPDLPRPKALRLPRPLRDRLPLRPSSQSRVHAAAPAKRNKAAPPAATVSRTGPQT